MSLFVTSTAEYTADFTQTNAQMVETKSIMERCMNLMYKQFYFELLFCPLCIIMDNNDDKKTEIIYWLRFLGNWEF
jgi:hypothetical protein